MFLDGVPDLQRGRAVDAPSGEAGARKSSPHVVVYPPRPVRVLRAVVAVVVLSKSAAARELDLEARARGRRVPRHRSRARRGATGRRRARGRRGRTLASCARGRSVWAETWKCERPGSARPAPPPGAASRRWRPVCRSRRRAAAFRAQPWFSTCSRSRWGWVSSARVAAACGQARASAGPTPSATPTPETASPRLLALRQLPLGIRKTRVTRKRMLCATAHAAPRP